MLFASPIDEYINEPRTKIIPKAAEVMFQTSVRVSISRKLCYGNDEKITERHRKISGVDGRHADICWLVSRMFGGCDGMRGK